MSEFKPFADFKSCWTLPSTEGDEFNVENGKKKITANGSIVITKDEAGAKTAEELATLFSSIAAAIRQKN